MLMKEAEVSSGPEKNAELVKSNSTSELMPQPCMDNENRDKKPERPKSSAVGPLLSDTSSGDQKQVLGCLSVTQLCHGLLRRWVELKPDTKLRVRSHLRQYSKPSEENIVVIDLTDEENDAVDRSNSKGIVIDDAAGYELGDDLSKDNKENFKSTIQIVKEKNDVANALSANERETGVERDESESVQRRRMKDIMVSKDISKPKDAKNSIANGDEGTSKSVVKEINVVSGDQLEADVEDRGIVQRCLSKDPMTIDDIPEKESGNENLSKNVDEGKTKTTLQSIEKQNIDTLHLPENQPEAYVKEQSNLTQDSQSKVMIVNDDGTEQEIGKVNSSKHVKRGISKTVVELIAKKKDIFNKRPKKCKYQSKLHRSQLKNITLSDDILRNKYGDAKSNNTVEFIARDKNTCILHLSDGVETGGHGLVQHNHSKDMMVIDGVPEYPGDVNSTEHDDHGKSKSATEFDVNKNIGTPRDDVEEGVEKTRNDLMPRSHIKDIVLIDDVPGQGLKHFSKHDDDGTAMCVKSNEGKNTKHISKNHNFHRTLNEELDDNCMITSSPKTNILRENQVNQDEIGLEVNNFTERHTDTNSLGTELNIIGDHQVNDDVPTPQSHILEQSYGDKDYSCPGANILGDHQIDENIPSPESNILKELQEIDVSKILALVHFDNDDENATIDNTNTEIDGVESKRKNIVFGRNVTKRNHKTAKIKKPNILQYDRTEHIEIMKVQKVTKTYENYNKKRKRRESCESKSETLVLHRNDTVYNENYSGKGTGYNDLTNINNSSKNVSEDIKNHKRMKSSELDDVNLFVDYNNSVNESDFINTLENNNATAKRNLMDSNEIDDSVNRNSVDVNMIRRSSNNGAGVEQSNSEVQVEEGALDLKLLMHPVVVIRKVTDRIWDELFTNKHSSRSSLRRSPTPSYDSPSDSPIPPYKSPSPLTTPRSSPYAPAPKSVLKNRAWRRLCKSREVLINEDKGERSRLAKRVELPDIEEVRRNNRNMLTAQVTPITQRQGDLGAETCAHDKCTNMRNSTSSVALPLSGRCGCAARRPASPAGSGDGQAPRGAAARARSLITSIAKKRKYISTKQYVNYNSIKLGVKPRGRKRRRRGRPRLASVSPHASANLEDVQTMRELVTCANEQNPTITCATHFRSSPPNDASSNLEDVKRTRDLITFEDEHNTTVTRVTVFRCPSNGVSSNLGENPQTARENEQETTRNFNPIEVAIPAILAQVPSNDAPFVQTLGSPTRYAAQNKQEKNTLVKPTKFGEKSHRRNRKRYGRPHVTSPSDDVTSVLDESMLLRDLIVPQNEEVTSRSFKPVTHHEPVPSNAVPSVNEDAPTRDLIRAQKEETNTLVTRLTTSSQKNAPVVLNEPVPSQDIIVIQNEQQKVVSGKPVNFDVKQHHRKQKRRGRPRFTSTDVSSVLDEVPTRDLTILRNKEEIIRRFNHVMNFESVPSSAAPSVLHESEPTRRLATAQRTQDTTTNHRSLKRTIRVASVPIHASSSFLKESLPMRNFTTPKNVETTTRTNKPLAFTFTVPNEPDFGKFTYGDPNTSDLNEEPTTTRNERNTAHSLKRVTTSVMNEGALRPEFSTAQNERGTKNSSDVLNPSVLKETVLTMQHDIVKALDRRRSSADCRLQCVSVPLTEEQWQKKASKFGFKPLLFRRGSSASSSCVLNEGVKTGDFDTAHEQETFSKRRGSEVDCFGMVKDAGNRIDSGLAEDRTSSSLSSLTKENLANASNVQPISELSSNICNQNLVADIKEECVKLVDSTEPGHVADEFSPVIVNVQSLALRQLRNKSNLQTCAPISTVQPNLPTITLKRADRLSVYASHLTNSSDIGQVFIPDARKQDKMRHPLSKLVGLVKCLPPASTDDQMKAQSLARDPGSAEKTPLPIMTSKKPTTGRPSARLNSLGEMQHFTTDSTMHPKETKQHFPKVVTDKSLPVITLKQAKLVCVSHPTNSSSEKQDFLSDSSVNLQEMSHLQEIIDLSDIRLPSHTNEQFSETTHDPDKSRLPVITLKREKTSCLNSSSDVLDTIGPMYSTQHLSPSSLPKIILKRALPVYASYQNSTTEMENLMSDSLMERVPVETHLPRVVDVMGDIHVIQPDDRMGLHLVVTEELSPNYSLPNISQPVD